jgi:formamidopyrimidine-DNA glycosylase
MPELPEVEVIRRALDPVVVGKRIERLTLREPRLNRRQKMPQRIPAMVAGQTIRALRRRGKFFLFDLGERTLVIHLGMTGQLRWWKKPVDFHPDVYTHAWMELSDDGMLSYRDIRKFGEIFLLPSDQIEATLRLGIEPLDRRFTAQALAERLRHSRTKIKSLLLDQRKVAGVGNIYADEALFRAGIRPTRPASSLRPAEFERLRAAIRTVLMAGIRHGGSTIANFRGANGEPGLFVLRHRVYHRQGKPCLVCRTPIRRIVLGQRGTHFCPVCQR